MDKNAILAAVIILIFFMSSQSQTTTPTTTTDGVDLTDTLDSSISFTGKDMFMAGTSTASEYVRVIALDGGTRLDDLGAKSLNSGTVSTKPNDQYILYYFFNDTVPSVNYYVSVERYTAPIQDATDNKVGEGCAIDTTLISSIRDSSGRTQSSTAYAQSVTANQVIDVSIRLKVDYDKCYGMPNIEKQNAICFAYPSAAFTKVETTTGTTNIPTSVSNNVTGKAISCYNMPVLIDGQDIELPIVLTASSTEPTIAHNITVYAEDIAFDLNQNTLAEIYDYNDESGNSLGAPLIGLGTIYIT